LINHCKKIKKKGNSMFFPQITLALPEWVGPFIKDWNNTFDTDEQKMHFVISLSEQNVRRQTGGPFGAAIFNCKSNTLVAPGVNVVVTSSCSLAHAEIMAIGIAQKKIKSFDLGIDCELFASTAPCAMCLGATPWSGVGRLVCAARDEDARSIGFDEGAKITDWVESLTIRGIKVRTDLMRQEAKAVLDLYAAQGGSIYNSRE
jgi:tRNA(Arg) A34 adenosine deaminase TadA